MKKPGSLFLRRFAIWPTLPPRVYFNKAANQLPFPLHKEGCRIYSLARHAIWNGCRALGLGANDVILVPAYHHGSEIESLLQAGLHVRYYEVNEHLAPDPEELNTLLGENVRALYLIHYLGFPQNALFWRRWCDARQLLLIEDAAQAFLSKVDDCPVGSFGQMGVFCLYKTYGLPDGGALISTAPPPHPASAPQTGFWRVLKRHANWMATKRGEIGFFHQLIKPAFARWKRLNEKPHAEFDLGDASSPASTMTELLLPKIIDEKTVESRRANYAFLLDHLRDMVPGPFSTLPDGACPFAFPLEVNEPKLFLENLRREGVLGLLFWLNPHPSLPVSDFPRSKALREKVVALPVHQELTLKDLIKIVHAVHKCRENQKAAFAFAG